MPKPEFRRLGSDPIAVVVTVICLLALIVSFPLMRRAIVDEPLQHKLESYANSQLQSVSGRIALFESNIRKQISAQNKLPGLAGDFQSDDQSALDRAEHIIAKVISDAESVYLVDTNLHRHSDAVGFAGRQMIVEALGGGSPSLRAVQVSGEWKVLAVGKIADDAGKTVGALLLRLPITGLRFALNTFDSTHGRLALQQTAGGLTPVDVIVLGTGNPQPVFSQQTTAPYWQLRFSPSDALIDLLDIGSSMMGLVYSLLIAAAALVVVLTARARLRTPALVKKVVLDDDEPPPEEPDSENLERLFPEHYKGINRTGVANAETVAERRRKIAEQQGRLLDVFDDDDEESGSEEPQVEHKPARKEPASSTTEQTVETGPIENSFNLAASEPVQSDADIFDLSERREDDILEVPSSIFRDYDIRGIAGKEITEKFALLLGKTLGTLLLRNGHGAIYLGRDARSTSKKIADALQNGLLSTGCNVISIGEVTTPLLNFATRHGGVTSCGVMVTASHNPARYNGFKIIVDNEVISGETLASLKTALNSKNFDSGAGNLNEIDMRADYISEIVEYSGIDKTFKLVIDAGNSVSGPIAVELFRKLGCVVTTLYCDINGSFPNHDPNPSVPGNLTDLCNRVKSSNADLGLALDGDGDRVVAVAGSGRIVWPDEMLMIFARDVLTRKPGSDIVFDVKSTNRLPALITSYSGRPVMCKTGHSHVRSAVHQHNAPLGGEFSGHIFFRERWHGFDDGMYAATRLLEILSMRDQTLDEVLEGLGDSSNTPELTVPIDEDKKFDLIKKIRSTCQFTGARINELDGLRVEYAFGWGLVRASNTSPCLTLRFEAENDEKLNKIRQIFIRELKPIINSIEDYI